MGQGGAFRTVEETLELGWSLLASFPPAVLTRIPAALAAARGRGEGA